MAEDVFAMTDPTMDVFGADVFALDGAAAGGTTTTLSFSRATTSQGSTGEIALSFASHLSLAGDLQPKSGKLPRFVHGQVAEVHYEFTVQANADIRAGDRTTVSGASLEASSIRHYGTAITEIDLVYVGR
jgi:hypothetical protein